MIRLDAATVLLQWATGGLLFLWVTTRRREVGLGYGWLLRASFGGARHPGVGAGRLVHPDPARDSLAPGRPPPPRSAALGVSVARRRAGVAGQRGRQERASARVAAMTGIDRGRATIRRRFAGVPASPRPRRPGHRHARPAAPPRSTPAGRCPWPTLRFLVGAAFYGAVTDAMLLGHWYLVQPGPRRAPLVELVRWTEWIWPFEVLVMLLPTGMVSVFSGTVDDGWDGVLGWMWLVCAVTTIGLCVVTRAALKERQYSAVMAATGLLYLAILTAFGMDLVARAVLAG